MCSADSPQSACSQMVSSQDNFVVKLLLLFMIIQFSRYAANSCIMKINLYYIIAMNIASQHKTFYNGISLKDVHTSNGDTN